MFEHVVVDSDDVMQSNIMNFRYPQGRVLEWRQNFHNVLDDGPFILCCEESLVITVFGILEGTRMWILEIGRLTQATLVWNSTALSYP